MARGWAGGGGRGGAGEGGGGKGGGGGEGGGGGGRGGGGAGGGGGGGGGWRILTHANSLHIINFYTDLQIPKIFFCSVDFNIDLGAIVLEKEIVQFFK